jgi:hypothetical protein
MATTVELFAGYWLCGPWCDRLGRDPGSLLTASLAVLLGAVATAAPTHADYAPFGVS